MNNFKKINNSNLEFRKIKSLKFLYEVNENGTIFRNVKSKKQLKIKLDFYHSNKEYYVTFVHFGSRKNPIIKKIMIHKVVAECWLGDCPIGYEVDHIDRDSHNNNYRNLRYVTKSEQMKNRDHSKIILNGIQNLKIARQQRMKPVKLIKYFNNLIVEELFFESFALCSKFLSQKYNKSFESMRYKLKSHRKHIFDYDVIYLNAETKHDNSTE